MSYSLKFLPSALKEWRKLAPEIMELFKAQLKRRLENPHIDAARFQVTRIITRSSSGR